MRNSAPTVPDPVSPDTKTRILFVISLSVFISLVGIGMVVPILSVYADTLGASSFWIGVVFAAFSFSRTVCMPLFGRLSDRYEKKQIMAAGLFFYAVISLGYIIAPTVALLTVVRFVHGIASAMIAPVAMAYLGGIAGEGEEARIMSRFQASMLFGFGAGPLMGGVIYDLFGFSAAFYALMAFSALACLIVVLFLPEERTLMPSAASAVGNLKKTESELYSGIPKGGVGLDGWRALCSFLGNPLYGGTMVISFVCEFGMIAILVFIPLFVPLLGISPAGAGIIISLNVFAAGTLQMAFGRIGDRKNRWLLIIPGALIFAVTLVLFPACTTLTGFLLVSFVNATGALFFFPAVSATMVEAGRVYGMGTTMGIYNSVRGASGIIAPLAGGLVADVFGLEAVFLLVGVFIAGGACIFFLLAAPSAYRHRRLKPE
ncbi:MFS transporter [Methanogenium sp. S4BF]|uniref:MFS transporter n=1 Tax=Methanogenium sp. S4BF TaxID=1789226 RepID=UPI002416B349|nr:MFS transporter [Methanogenium sp. S4BF]WFN34347.1 MFS transporter [Methanogenium sp. S4BF]